MGVRGGRDIPFNQNVWARQDVGVDWEEKRELGRTRKIRFRVGS